MDGNYTISGSNDVLEFSIRAALAKGDLISEIISRWLKSPKQFAKHSCAQNSHLALFWEIGTKMKNFLRLSHLYLNISLCFCDNFQL
jgi:hypothetical protein